MGGGVTMNFTEGWKFVWGGKRVKIIGGAKHFFLGGGGQKKLVGAGWQKFNII